MHEYEPQTAPADAAPTRHEPVRESVRRGAPMGTAGRATTRAHAPLLLGRADDPAEREADSIAARVIDRINRTSEGHQSAEPSAAGAGRVRRSATSGPAPDDIDADVASRIQRARGRGAPMPEPVRRSMEGAFGADFSGVRFHQGPQETELNSRLSARAFTVGQDVFFGNGADVGDPRLVAHELAHTLQQSDGVRREVIRRNDHGSSSRQKAKKKKKPKFSPEAVEIGKWVREGAYEDELEYAYRGLGGGGTGIFRSSEVRSFRKGLKNWARDVAYADIDTEYKKTKQKSPTSDYRKMMAGNIAYDDTKAVIDDKLKEEAERLIDTGLLDNIERIATSSAERELRYAYSNVMEYPYPYTYAAGRAEESVRQDKHILRDKTRDRKDAVVGKRDYKQDDTDYFTTEGAKVSDRMDDAVHKLGVGEKALVKAIDAPSMSLGLRILGRLIDGVLTAPGEQVDLSIQFNIPTGTGITIVLKMQGTAAKGIDGATTAGVPLLGDPKRVEVSAKLSGGVAADAIGLKSSATIGIFVRAGSDQGTRAALQALSYGAYTGAPNKAGWFKDLWAPEDKRGKFDSKRRRAEMWAAMVEEQVFKGTDGSTFADVGMALDGSFGANVGVAKYEATIGESIFTHFDEATLSESLGKSFAGRVKSDKSAKERRHDVSGAKKLALSGGFSMSHNIPGTPHAIEFSVGVSGSSIFANWGVEIIAGCGMASTEDVASEVERNLNAYATGLGEAIKKVRGMLGDALDQAAGDKSSGDAANSILGSVAQIPADITTIIDGDTVGSISDAIGGPEHEVGVSAFDTKIGGTPEVDEAGNTITSKMGKVFEASSIMQFALYFGVNAADPKHPSKNDFVVRLEIRSKRGIDVGGGGPVEVSASKTSRLAAIGRDGAAGWKVELFGGRIG